MFHHHHHHHVNLLKFESLRTITRYKTLQWIITNHWLKFEWWKVENSYTQCETVWPTTADLQHHLHSYKHGIHLTQVPWQSFLMLSGSYMALPPLISTSLQVTYLQNMILTKVLPHFCLVFLHLILILLNVLMVPKSCKCLHSFWTLFDAGFVSGAIRV